MLRVVVTRPQAQAVLWVERLAERGIDAVALPLIDILPPADTAPVDAAWASLATRRMVVFVSPNAVHQFFARRPADRADWPAAATAAAIGPGTTDALLRAGVPEARIVEPPRDEEQFDSEALWQRLQDEDWNGASVLIVRGDGGREWLADTLRARGARIEFVSAYRRAAPRWNGTPGGMAARLNDAVARPSRHVWLFSSSEAIDHLMALKPGQVWRPAQCLVTHPRIGERARACGFGTVHACRPTLDAVAGCIQSIAAHESVTEAAPASALPAVLPAAAPAAPIPAVIAAVAPPPAPKPELPPAAASPVPPPPAPPAMSVPAPAGPPRSPALQRVLLTAVVVALLAAIGGLAAAWQSNQRVKRLEQELVRRQTDSQGASAEARVFAKQAQEGMRDNTAKLAVLEARVAEVAVQRSQLEELIQSVSRSRDENLLADIDAGLRVAMQQSAITGSAEPLVAVLRQSDDRLARYAQPRLEGVRRAIARDLDAVKGVSVTDISSLSIKLDEAVRLVDEVPLLAVLEPRKGAAAAAKPAAPAASGATSADLNAAWTKAWREGWAAASERVWSEAKSLVRVTRIDNPEAMLVAPEQAFFLRENLKLRLLNARLALLSRQFETAQLDLQAAQSSLERYFDRSSRRHMLAADLLKQIATQSRHVGVPKPDATLSAIAAATAGR